MWVDENGVTNYAERNPKGYDADHVTPSHRFGERILTPRQAEAAAANSRRPGGQTPSPAAPADEVDPDALIADEAARIARDIAETKRSNCEVGKKNLTNLKMYTRIRVTDENGQERLLTPAEKDQKMEEARQVIKENCTG
ncbi:MAG: hypothetical protein KDI36_01715 [Pseudomonadales bacterium]|nr:hypothetical protein [Pseudomonadales bacterium]